MKKLVLVVIGIIILSGCTANVKLTIDSQDNVSEFISLYESNEIIKDNEMTKEEFINSTFEFYGTNKANNYIQKKKYNDLDTGVEFSRKSSNICESFKTSSFSDFFSEIDCIEKRDYYEVKAKSDFMICTCECSNVSDVVLEIQLPEKAISSDASIVEENKYIWKYSRNEQANFNLKIKRHKKSVSNLVKNIKTDSGNLKNIILFFFSIVLMAGLVIIILYEKYKKNKIEY